MPDPGVDIIVNGGFATPDNWTWGGVNPVYWVHWPFDVPSQALSMSVYSSGTVQLTQSLGGNLEHGEIYKITYTITLFEVTTGYGGAMIIQPILGGTGGPIKSAVNDGPGTYTCYLTAGAANDNIVFQTTVYSGSTAIWVCVIDNVICKKIILPSPAYDFFSSIYGDNATLMSLSATLIEMGGETCDVFGFAYSTTNPHPRRATDSYCETIGVYDSYVDYYQTILPLQPNTFYYLQPYYHNGAGYGYNDSDGDFGYYTGSTKIKLSKLKCSGVKFT